MWTCLCGEIPCISNNSLWRSKDSDSVASASKTPPPSMQCSDSWTNWTSKTRRILSLICRWSILRNIRRKAFQRCCRNFYFWWKAWRKKKKPFYEPNFQPRDIRLTSWTEGLLPELFFHKVNICVETLWLKTMLRYQHVILCTAYCKDFIKQMVFLRADSNSVVLP